MILNLFIYLYFIGLVLQTIRAQRNTRSYTTHWWIWIFLLILLRKNIQTINSVKFLEILSLKNHKNFHVKNYLFFVIIDDPTKKCFNAKAFFRKILSPGGVFQVYLLPKFNPRSLTGKVNKQLTDLEFHFGDKSTTFDIIYTIVSNLPISYYQNSFCYYFF